MQKQTLVAAGLDLGGTNLKFGLVGPSGDVLFMSTRPAGNGNEREEILQGMGFALREAIQWADKKNLSITAVGVGCPGNIDVRTGTSIGPTPHLPDWEGAPIRSSLSRFGYPVFVDNDANMAAYGEFKAGAGRGCSVVVTLTLGTGIGGGVVIDGTIFRGSGFSGAELGHVCVEAMGRECACGNRGCMERYAGGKSIVDDARNALQLGRPSSLSRVADITPLEIFNAAGRGDALAREITEQVVTYLAAGLSSIVNVLDPDVILIGGGIADAGNDFIACIDSALRSRVMKPVKKRLVVRHAALGNNAGFIGAGLYALDQMRK